MSSDRLVGRRAPRLRGRPNGFSWGAVLYAVEWLLVSGIIAVAVALIVGWVADS